MQAVREDPLTDLGDWLRCIDVSHVYDAPVHVGDICRCGKMSFVIPDEEPMIRRKTTEERLDWLTAEVATLRVQMNKLLNQESPFPRPTMEEIT